MTFSANIEPIGAGLNDAGQGIGIGDCGSLAARDKRVLAADIPEIGLQFDSRINASISVEAVHAASNEKSRLRMREPAFRSLAPHRGYVSNFLYRDLARGQSDFREYGEITDILNLYPQLGKAGAQNFGLGGRSRPRSSPSP